jgi:hypothetical protein
MSSVFLSSHVVHGLHEQVVCQSPRSASSGGVARGRGHMPNVPTNFLHVRHFKN